jgi:hypothetical protein
MKRLIKIASTVTVLWNSVTLRNPEDETIRLPKRRFEITLDCTKSQYTSIIGTAVKASQKTVFFDQKYIVYLPIVKEVMNYKP